MMLFNNKTIAAPIINVLVDRGRPAIKVAAAQTMNVNAKTMEIPMETNGTHG
jgi:methylthioribose-1-phosphate isomerase